jgi:hypothetical protein
MHGVKRSVSVSYQLKYREGIEASLRSLGIDQLERDTTLDSISVCQVDDQTLVIQSMAELDDSADAVYLAVTRAAIALLAVLKSNAQKVEISKSGCDASLWITIGTEDKVHIHCLRSDIMLSICDLGCDVYICAVPFEHKPS